MSDTFVIPVIDVIKQILCNLTYALNDVDIYTWDLYHYMDMKEERDKALQLIERVDKKHRKELQGGIRYIDHRLGMLRYHLTGR